MKYQKTSYPVQQLATGEKLFIHAYSFEGTLPGPSIYLQANLHGPEIFGTTLLGKIITFLEKRANFPGKIIVVPCANPVAVQVTEYNSQGGRWNVQNGNNWNRIFQINQSWNSREEEKQYYTNLLQSTNLSIENTLASTLKILSSTADYVIDIHTTGSKNENHLFVDDNSSSVFIPLGASVHILWDKENAVGAFDESHIFSHTVKQTHACTWEAHHHGDIDSQVLQQRFEQLTDWLQSIWCKKIETKMPKQIKITNTMHLVSEVGGYYTWTREVGEKIKQGEIYAHAYQPWTNTTIFLKAKKSFILLSTYGIGAIASGQQIGWIAYSED